MVKGIGVDIVNVDKLDSSIKRWGRRFLKHIFTAREIEYCQSRYAGTLHFAGRFAAKEAALKALGTGWQNGIHLKQIEILNGSLGAPEIKLFGQAMKRAQELGIDRFHLSISHNDQQAVSVVVAEEISKLNKPGT